MGATIVAEVTVTLAERATLAGLAAAVRDRAGTAESDVVVAAEQTAAQLPDEVGGAVDSLRAGECVALVLRGCVDDAAITGPTPTEHLAHTPPLDTGQVVHALLAARLGTAYGYLGQQHGRIFNDIVPVAGRLDVANFSGGTGHRFELHTEDAFHPARADWITLMCRRNHGMVPTIVAAPDPALLGEQVMDVLARRAYRLRANPAQGGRAADPAGLDAVVAPGRHGPAFRYNFCVDGSTDDPGRDALQALLDHLVDRQHHVELAAGDCLLVDNQRAFHARDPYTAHLDGADRWMNRVIVVESPTVIADHLAHDGFRRVRLPGNG